MNPTTEHAFEQAPAQVPGMLPVVCQPHAFAQHYQMAVAPEGRTIAEIVAEMELPPVVLQYLHVWVDDHEVPAEFWPRVKPKIGHTIYVRVVAQGGGDGNKLLRTVLTIAIAAAAIYTGQLYGLKVGTMLGLSGTTASVVGGAIVATSVSMLGNMALNALIPPQLPTSPELGSFGAPRYQLTGTQNRFEPYATIPRVFGKRRVYPLMAARPYSETQGKDEYIRLALLVGWGPLAISDIRIGDTPISAFSPEIEIRQGWLTDAPLSLYTNTVAEQSFNILLEKPTESAAAHSVRTTDLGTSEVSVDLNFPAGIGYVDDNGNRIETAVQFEVGYRQTGTVNWVNASITTFSNVTVISAGVFEVKGSDTSVVRASVRFATGSSPGQWDVRLRKLTTERGSRYVEMAYWSVLRSIAIKNPIPEKGFCLLGIRLKATGQLNGVPQSINCIAESYLPVWNGSAWNWEISRNPAWAYAHVLRYRGWEQMIADSRIDLTTIKAWADACNATAPNAVEPYWRFDGVIEGGSVFGALRQIAAHSRASFAIKDGKYSVTREVLQTVPVQHITPRNSISYSGRKDFLDYPHALRVQFVNADAGYQEDERIVYDDGYSAANATRFETLELPGCTSSTQAWREGRYLIAAGRLRPEEHVVTMDVEAVRCQQGDMVRFSHDVISIGIAATRIASRTVNGSNNITSITLEETVLVDAIKFYAFRARKSDGSSVVFNVQTGGSGMFHTFNLTSTLSASAGPTAGDLVMFGEVATESAPMIVKKIENGPDFTARVTLVDAQSGIYTADTGAIPAFTPNITIQRPIDQVSPDAPSFVDIRSNESVLLRLNDGTLQDRIAIAVLPPPPSTVSPEVYETYWRRSGETSWNVTSTPKDSAIYLSPVMAGYAYEIKTRSVSRYGAAGQFNATTLHTVVGKTTPPSAPANVSAQIEQDTILLTWPSVLDADLSEYEVRRGTVWDTAAFVNRSRSTSLKVGVDAIGTLTYLVKAIDSIGLYSISAASTSIVVTGPLAVSGSASFSGDQVVLRWNAPTSPLPLDYYEVRYGTSFAAGTSIATIKGTTFSTKANWASTRTFWVAAIDVNGNIGTAGSIEAQITTAPATTLTTQVVDNNVLLYWGEVAGSLPTETYEIRRGSTWAGGTVVGTKAGAFTTIFETVAGTYTYWIAARDTAGNYGTPSSVAATVAQPPDYILQVDSNSTFSGTKVNMDDQPDGSHLLPVDTSETFAAHFTSRSWASPQAQVDAGFPLFIQPSVTSGYYEETKDLGALVPASKITLTVNGATVSGTVTVATKLSISTDGSTWTDYDNVSSVFATSFRYVKFRVTVTGANTTSLYRINGINLRVDSKLRSDAGTATCNSADAGGTTVNFTVPFIDVVSIEVTAKGTTPVIAIYDFTDVPNPTSFKILLFSTSGTRVSGDVSWSVKGY